MHLFGNSSFGFSLELNALRIQSWHDLRDLQEMTLLQSLIYILAEVRLFSLFRSLVWICDCSREMLTDLWILFKTWKTPLEILLLLESITFSGFLQKWQNTQISNLNKRYFNAIGVEFIISDWYKNQAISLYWNQTNYKKKSGKITFK
jgi:hypothetical protein